MPRTTVILPCAGKGTRLGLPYPKEMMQLEEGKSIIDYSFDLLANEPEGTVQFVVVLSPHKMELARYLYKYAASAPDDDPSKHKFLMSFVFQDPAKKDLAGAIKSAQHLFSGLNIVLLPDSIMKLKTDRKSLVKLFKKGVKATGFSFMYVKSTDPHRLKQQGCLRVKGNRVKDYEDKPKDPSRFNAYWTAYAFKPEVFESCIEVIEKSTRGKKYTITNSPIHQSTAVEVEAFVDMGTWDSVQEKLAHSYLLAAGIDPRELFGR